MPDKRARDRAGADWERRLSAGFACRGLDAPGARSAAREPGGWAGWKAGDPSAVVSAVRTACVRQAMWPARWSRPSAWRSRRGAITPSWRRFDRV